MYIGIDLGGTNLAIGLVNENCQIIDKISMPTGREREFVEIIADASNLINVLLERNNLTTFSLYSIGMASPGILDTQNRIIINQVNFPKVNNENLQEELWKYFPNIPVYLENDANAAAYGEAIAGAARGLKDAIMVTLGTGVGGGIIINEKIYSGFNHVGSELGHMVLNFNGPRCNCGRNGCFEVYASATALIRQTKEIIQMYPDSIIHSMIEHNLANINGKTAFDAARQQDEAGEKIVKEYIEYLGVGLVDLINTFYPEAIVIGGGISKEGNYLISRLEEYVKRFAYIPENVAETRLLTAELGNDAGIIGAAMLWKQEGRKRQRHHEGMVKSNRG